MFLNVSIKQRLMLFVGIVCAIQIIVAAMIFSKLTAVEHHINGVAKRDMPIIEAITQITEHQLEQEVLFERAFRFSLELDSVPHALEGFKHAVENFESINLKVTDEVKNTKKLVEQAVHDALTDEASAEFKKVNQQLASIDEHHQQWGKHAEEVFALLVNREFHHADEVAEKVEHEAENLTQEVESLLKEVEEFTKHAVLSVEHETQSLEIAALVSTLISVVVSIAIAWFIIVGIDRGLGKATAALKRCSEGDFGAHIPSDESGEIGELLCHLNETRQAISATLSQMSLSTKQVEEAANSLAEATTHVQENVQLQLREVDQVAAAINEMASTSQEVAANAASTHNATEEAVQRSTESQAANQQAMEHTGQLVESLTMSGEALSELEKSSQSIGAVLDVIKGIAEQTNLLALNAAIEAARAGEQGRGFAVVADEVRTLAQRTQESTKQIEEMIDQFRAGAEESVKSMEQSRTLGGMTIEHSQRSSEQMTLVNAAITTVTDMSMQIASAAEQQSSVVDEINRNITSVHGASESTGQQVSQAAAISEELSATARELNESMQKFKL